MWSDPATWGGSGCPTNNGDTFTIGAHTVYFDCDLSSLTDGLAGGTINGSLVMDKAYPCFFAMNGNITGTGSWLVGDADAADMIDYTADNLPKVVIRQKSGTIQLSTAGNVKWYGLTNGFHAWATNTANIGDTNLFFASYVSNVASNDVIYVSNPAVIGQAGSYHLVHSVETNRITVWDAVPSWAGLVTNTWAGTAIIGSINTANRTNAFVVKLSRPIVVYQPTRISNTGIFSAGASNVLAGTMFANLARGAVFNSLNSWTLTGCAAVSCANGGFTYGGNFHAGYECVAAGCAGGAWNSLSGGLVVRGVVVNGSPLMNGGVGAVARDTVAINNTAGGVMGACYGSVSIGAICQNNLSGGVMNGSHSCHAYGGACAGNSSGVAYLSSGTVESVIISNSSTPMIAYGPGDIAVSHNEPLTSSQAFTLLTQRMPPFVLVAYNGTNYLAAYGSTEQTNWSDAQIWAHRPTAASADVPYYLDVAVKPQSVRSVEIGAWGRADCYYSYAVTPAGMKPLGGLTPIATSAGQWSYVSAQLTNTLPVPQTLRLWVNMTNATAATEGWTRVNLPTDYTVRVQ